MLRRQKPNGGRHRQIRILADPASNSIKLSVLIEFQTYITMPKSVKPCIRYFGVRRRMEVAQRQIRISADPFEFHQTHHSGEVSAVDYDAKVRLTLHTILWRQKPNGSRQRQIRILADPFELHQNQCFNRVSDVDYDAEVRSTLHTILWCQKPN